MSALSTIPTRQGPPAPPRARPPLRRRSPASGCRTLGGPLGAFERHEGMRANSRAGALVASGRMRVPATAVRPIAAERVAGLDSLLSAEEVARIVGVRVDYIWALCRADEIPHLRFGRVKRFRRSAIAEWLERREQGATR